MKRHHYGVTVKTVGGARPAEETRRWYHTFEEADTAFEEAASEMDGSGMSLKETSYWRRQFSGPESSTEVKLDDEGVVECGPLCGAA